MQNQVAGLVIVESFFGGGAGAVGGGGFLMSSSLTVTVFRSCSLSILIVADRSVLPGARAVILYVPPSIGSAWFQVAGSTTSLPRRTSRPAACASATIVSVDSRGSSFAA